MLISDPLLTAMYDVWDECHNNWKHIFGGELQIGSATTSVRVALTSLPCIGDEMVTRCAAHAKGATKSTVTSEEKGLHRALRRSRPRHSEPS